MKKRGTILVENIIFIVLNLLFLIILVLFIARQGGGAIVLEQSYAKQIALLVDSAKPVMVIHLNMDNAQKLADKNEIDFSEVVEINGNIVTVRLSERGGYSYSFFNDVNVTAFPGVSEGVYIFTISEKTEREVEGEETVGVFNADVF